MNMEDGTKLGDNPAVIKAFAMLADKMGEDKIVQADGPIMQTPKQIDKEINNLTAPNLLIGIKTIRTIKQLLKKF